MSFYSIADYVGDGSTTTFVVPFPYISEDHVEVYVSGVLKTEGTDYTWPNAGQVTLSTPPGLAASVRVKRNTPKDSELVTFTNGSQLVQEDLNNASIQLLYIQQEVIDYTTETLASITSIAASTGNVPAPQSPTDDSKVLQALSGTFAWTNTINVTAATAGTLTSTGPLTVGGGAAVTGNVNVSGQINADTSSVTGISVAGTFAAVTTVASPLVALQVESGSASSLRFWKWDHSSGDSFTPTPAKPQWELQVPSSSAVLVLNMQVGGGPLNVVGYDYDAATGAARIRPYCHTVPGTPGAYDLGSSSVARFRNAYLTGNIDSTQAVGGGVNVLADVQWDATNGRIQKRFIQLPIVGTSPQAWTDAVVESNMVTV